MRMKILGVFTVIAALLMFPAVTLAAQPQKTNGFVCPVITADAVGEHNPQAGELGDTGNYTIPGPEVSVPILATNGDGDGVPSGPHSQPGDMDYTAVWAGN